MERPDKEAAVIKNTSFCILCFLIAFTPLARGGIHMWARTIVQMVTLAGCGLLLLRYFWADYRPEQKVVRDFLVIAAPVFLLTAISTVFSRHRYLAFEGMSMTMSYLAIYYLALDAVRTRKEQRYLVYFTIGVAVVLVVFGFIKQMGMNPFPWWDYPELVKHGDKSSITSTYGNRNHFAGFLEMVIPIVLGLFLTRYRTWDRIFGLICLVILLMLTQVLTLSRGGWAATAVSVIFMMAVLMVMHKFRRKKMLLAISVGVMILCVVALASSPVAKRLNSLSEQKRISHVAGRVRIWQGTLSLIRANWITGTGINTFKEAYPEYQIPGPAVLTVFAHNDYLQFIAETGILFIPVTGWILFVFFRRGIRNFQSPSRQTWGISLGAMGGIVAILVHSLVDFNLQMPANMVLFICLGVLMRSREPLV